MSCRHFPFSYFLGLVAAGHLRCLVLWLLVVESCCCYGGFFSDSKCHQVNNHSTITLKPASINFVSSQSSLWASQLNHCFASLIAAVLVGSSTAVRFYFSSFFDSSSICLREQLSCRYLLTLLYEDESSLSSSSSSPFVNSAEIPERW